MTRAATRAVSSDAHTVAVIGLGKLGACLAVCLAHKGFYVIGVDRSKRVLDAFREGLSPVVEPGLQEMLSTARTRLEVTEDMYESGIAHDDPRAPRFAVYQYLGYLEEQVVEAVARGLDARGGS